MTTSTITFDLIDIVRWNTLLYELEEYISILLEYYQRAIKFTITVQLFDFSCRVLSGLVPEYIGSVFC